MKKTEIDLLLQKIAGGDNDAFARLYERTSRGVFSFLYTYLKNYEDTQDAMQTVYLKVKTGISSYRFGTNGRAWLLQIAKNHALNELEKRKRVQPLDEVNEGELAVHNDGVNESGVMQTMQRVLSEEERRIVTLHVLWGYKHREIAEIIDSPTGTVTSKYKRAVEKLKRAIKEESK